MQYQSNQTNPQPTPEDTAQNASTPASEEAGNGQQESGWKQKIQTLLKKCTIPFVIVGALFLIVGVPIIINELYKRPGYVTMWSAADVLAYYGTVLGGVITVGTMAVTTWFSWRQLRRESYLRSEYEKWSRIENLISEIINLLNPMTLIIIKKDQKPKKSAKEATDAIQMCMIKMNLLNGNTTVQDKNKIEKLWNAIDDFIQRSLEVYRRIYASTENCFEDFIVNQGCGDLNTLYDNNYNKLISLKAEIFSQIYTDIQKEADSILSPWRKH